MIIYGILLGRLTTGYDHTILLPHFIQTNPRMYIFTTSSFLVLIFLSDTIIMRCGSWYLLYAPSICLTPDLLEV